MDWSDKKEAFEIDTKSGSLRNHHTDKQFYSGAAKFEEVQEFIYSVKGGNLIP
jgi:hypothetical protein